MKGRGKRIWSETAALMAITFGLDMVFSPTALRFGLRA